MGGGLDHHSGALQTQDLSQEVRGADEWLACDELHARGQKWLRLGTLAGELAGISRERWRVIVQGCGQRVVVF